MSFLKKSLEKRIHELRKSIEAQKTELAAYEQVLALESGKPVERLAPAPAAVAAVVAHHKTPTPAAKKAPIAKKATPAAAPKPTGAPVSTQFNGSRSDFVVSAVKERGAAGITPPEIAAAFATRKIAISKNLVYNVLSLMFKRKTVRKSAGRYYYIGGSSKPAAPPAASAQPKSAAAAPPKKKSRISEEGMRRIIAATKKRWAAQRAAKSKAR